MKSLLPMIPFVAALGLLACQGDDGPVAEGATTAVPDNVVGDRSASGVAAPENAAAAEAVDRAALPLGDTGMAWTAADGGNAASFGPSGAGALLIFACRGTGSARHLLVTRLSPSHPGRTATLSFTGGGQASSLPMRAVAKPGGPGESEWQGEARGDMARAVAKAFAGGGLVNVTLGGAPALAVPTSPLASTVFKRCS
jgi:hypothetical protein